MNVRIFLFLFFVSFYSCDNVTTNTTDDLSSNSRKPALGWNSYDSYGNEITEEQVLENLDVFINKLVPYNYEFFTIDAGWDDCHNNMTLDQYGRHIPSSKFFPNGFNSIIKKANDNDVKFGLWLARGISKKAYQENLKIKGTEFYAQDIADTNDVSDWWPHHYGIDVNKPGAQEYYNSVFELLADWGIDFVKYDDIIPHPDEIEAIANAIENCGRSIYLSLSPGDNADTTDIEAYLLADQVRITSDVWDRPSDIAKGFTRWFELQSIANKGFFFDLDMIPIGTIKVPYDDSKVRNDNFSAAQKRTFITQRALSASPLIIGSRLAYTNDSCFALFTNAEMLNCNQNGYCGERTFKDSTIEIWKTTLRDQSFDTGWIGIFNRSSNSIDLSISSIHCDLVESLSCYSLFDIWNDISISSSEECALSLAADDVCFLKYSKN